MRECKKCKKELDEINFSVLKTGRILSYCKTCSNNAAKKAYKNNPKKIISQASKFRKKLKLLSNKIKEKYGCSFCDVKEGICLDFHHLDSSKKESEVSSFLGRKMKKQAFEEINKCIVVCSNCHRKVHANLLDASKIPLCNEDIYEYFEKVGDRLRLKKE